MNRKMTVLFGLIIVSMILSGCESGTDFSRRSFVLEASRSGLSQQPTKDIILTVRRFNIDKTFSTKSFVYRKGQSEYETDFYNQFLVMPNDTITGKARSWLSESALFKLVLESGSYADATHMLEGNIVELYGDFRDKTSPKASMKMRFFLIQLSDKAVVFAKTYEATSGAGDRKVESLVRAFDDCLKNILSDLEQDLSDQL